MADYISSTDLQNYLGGSAFLQEISDQLNTSTNANAVSAAIAASTALIDVYAFNTPGTGTTPGALWDSTPPIVTTIALAIATSKLFEAVWGKIPDDRKLAYDRAIELLKDLAAGKISFVSTEDSALQETATIYYFGPGSTARDDNPRRCRRDQLDGL